MVKPRPKKSLVNDSIGSVRFLKDFERTQQSHPHTWRTMRARVDPTLLVVSRTGMVARGPHIPMVTSLLMSV